MTEHHQQIQLHTVTDLDNRTPTKKPYSDYGAHKNNLSYQTWKPPKRIQKIQQKRDGSQQTTTDEKQLKHDDY